MKSVSLAVLGLALLVLAAPVAEAKTCFGLTCNYIDTNQFFTNNCTDWSCPGPTYFPSFPNATTCGNSSKVCQIGNYAVLERNFEVDDTFTNSNGVGLTTFKLEFDLYLPNDSDNYYDELTVTVRNEDTGIEETRVFRGSNSPACQNVDWWLNNDYSNAEVTVTFEGGSLILHPWQIDGVSFWAYI